MSEATSRTKCPKCGLAGNPGEFCMNGCGRLPAAACPDISSGQPEGMAPGSSVAEKLDPPTSTDASSTGNPNPAGAEETPGEKTDSGGRIEVPADFTYGNPFASTPSGGFTFGNPFKTSAAQAVPASTAQAAPPPAADGGEECPVDLEGRVPDSLVEGCTIALEFKARCRRDYNISAAILRLCAGEEVLASAKSCNVRPGRWAYLPINFQPERAGLFAVRLVLECPEAGESYESEDFTIAVYPDDLKQAKSIAVNITNEYRDIHVDRAGDARFGAASNDIADAIRNASSGETMRQIIERCARVREVRRYPLRAARLPSRLTLIGPDGFELHVFSDNVLRFGRSRYNDIVLRVIGAGGRQDDNLSRAISRTHFRILYQTIRCHVADGGPANGCGTPSAPETKCVPSTHGTAVSGTRLRPGGTMALTNESDQTIEIAPGVTGASGPVLALGARTGKCPECHRAGCGRKCPPAATASLFLTRTDGAREAYLAVWRCAPLGDFLPGFDGYFLHWDGSMFSVEKPSGETIPLRLGVEFGPADHAVTATPFKQSV